MIRLGITGGIGSGKTIVCSIFERLGAPVYNADLRAKWLINNNTDLKLNLIQQFGEDSFKDGQYNTAYISKIVFGDSKKLALLNSIIHPTVFEDWKLFCEEHKSAPIVIKEAAIMLETESRFTVDQIALVYAPENIRIQRVMERDHISEATLRIKLNAQMPEEEKLSMVDYVIINDGEQSLIEQVQNLYSDLTASKNLK